MNTSTETEIKNLLKDVVQLFQEKKKSKKISARVQRGRASSIANEFEDRFATLLEKALPYKYSIFVDYPLSYKVEGRKRYKTSYPDVAIIRDSSVLVGIIELKIDLGYLPRGWADKTKAEFEHLCKAEKIRYKTDIGTDKAMVKELSVARELHKATVVLTGKNDHRRLLGFSKQENCFVLSRNIHPNDYAINDSNKIHFVEKIISDPDNIKSWRKFAEFLNDNFE